MRGRANALFTEGASGQGQLAWVQYYAPCEGNDIVISPGGVHVDSLEGNIASGTLNAQLYYMDECQLKTRKLSATFKLKIVEDF